MKRYYIAYGSNLNLNQMFYICPSARVLGKSFLPGYRLVFKSGGYLSIEKDAEKRVPIGVFELSFFDSIRLNVFERYPELYEKKYFNININNQNIHAFLYVMRQKYDFYFLPNAKYLKTCYEGYQYFGFDQVFLNEALEYSYEKLNKQKKSSKEL